MKLSKKNLPKLLKSIYQSKKHYRNENKKDSKMINNKKKSFRKRKIKNLKQQSVKNYLKYHKGGAQQTPPSNVNQLTNQLINQLSDRIGVNTGVETGVDTGVETGVGSEQQQWFGNHPDGRNQYTMQIIFPKGKEGDARPPGIITKIDPPPGLNVFQFYKELFDPSTPVSLVKGAETISKGVDAANISKGVDVETNTKTLPAKIAETLPAKIAETLPAKIAETLPAEIDAETLPAAIAETLPTAIAETLPAEIAVAKALEPISEVDPETNAVVDAVTAVAKALEPISEVDPETNAVVAATAVAKALEPISEVDPETNAVVDAATAVAKALEPISEVDPAVVAATVVAATVVAPEVAEAATPGVVKRSDCPVYNFLIKDFNNTINNNWTFSDDFITLLKNIQNRTGDNNNYVKEICKNYLSNYRKFGLKTHPDKNNDCNSLSTIVIILLTKIRDYCNDSKDKTLSMFDFDNSIDPNKVSGNTNIFNEVNKIIKQIFDDTMTKPDPKIYNDFPELQNITPIIVP